MKSNLLIFYFIIGCIVSCSVKNTSMLDIDKWNQSTNLVKTQYCNMEPKGYSFFTMFFEIRKQLLDELLSIQSDERIYIMEKGDEGSNLYFAVVWSKEGRKIYTFIYQQKSQSFTRKVYSKADVMYDNFEGYFKLNPKEINCDTSEYDNYTTGVSVLSKLEKGSMVTKSITIQ